MSVYYGDLDPGDILDFKFTTVRDTGAPADLCSPTLVVFKDNGTTCDTSGVTLTAAFGGRTGLNHVRIDTASCGTFYAAGSNFDVVLSAGTVNSVSVAGYAVGAFSLHHRAPLRPTVSARTLDVTAAGSAALDWSNIENPGASVNLAGTTVDLTALSDAVLDAVVEGTTTVRQSVRLQNAALAGKLSGAATTTVAIRDLNDCRDRITATVDADGNRSAVVLDLS